MSSDRSLPDRLVCVCRIRLSHSLEPLQFAMVYSLAMDRLCMGLFSAAKTGLFDCQKFRKNHVTTLLGCISRLHRIQAGRARLPEGRKNDTDKEFDDHA